MFIEYNRNPNGDNIDDCVIRAISFCTNKPYWDVFDGLCEIADELKLEVNSFAVFNKYLTNNDYELREFHNKMTVKAVADMFAEYDEKIMLLVNDHVTSVYKGDTYDTWNCNRYIARFMWIRKGV